MPKAMIRAGDRNTVAGRTFDALVGDLMLVRSATSGSRHIRLDHSFIGSFSHETDTPLIYDEFVIAHAKTASGYGGKHPPPRWTFCVQYCEATSEHYDLEYNFHTTDRDGRFVGRKLAKITRQWIVLETDLDHSIVSWELDQAITWIATAGDRPS